MLLARVPATRLKLRGHLFASYYKLFPRVLVVGHTQYHIRNQTRDKPRPPPIDLVCPPAFDGLGAHVYLAEVTRLYPQHNGWLQLHFDCLADFVRLTEFPVDRIWTPSIQSIPNTAAHLQKENGGWRWPTIRDSVEAVYIGIDNIIDDPTNLTGRTLMSATGSAIRQRYQRYKDNYIRNMGSWDNWPRSYADVFYLPARFAKDWQELALPGQLVDRSDVFLEVAYGQLVNLIVPSIESCVTILPGTWSYGEQVVVKSFEHSIQQPNIGNDTKVWFHQVHLDSPRGVDMIRQVVDRALTK